MGILHKDCPRCATTVATYIARCDCGFLFDGNADADPAARLEALAEEERLYEEYLTARAKQASAAAADAEAAMRAEPDLYYMSTDAERAIATRDAVLAELNQQKLRTTEILATIEAVKTGYRNVHVLKPHAHKHPESNPLEPAPVVSSSKVAAKPRTTAIPAIVPPTAPPKPTVVADPPRAKADDTSTYTSKLEEILKGAIYSEAPEPVADAVPLLLPAPQAPMRSANGQPSVGKISKIVSIPEAVVPTARAAAPIPSLTPEEALERAAKAVRSRAMEMATRHGAVKTDASFRAIPDKAIHEDHAGSAITKDATPSKTKTTATASATPNSVVASGPREAVQTAETVSIVATIPASVETAASAEADSCATPKKQAFHTESRQQMRARHARTAKTQSGKRDQQPTGAHVLISAPSDSAASPQPAMQEAVMPTLIISDHPSVVFRATQAAKAEKIVQETKTRKAAEPNHCPYCSATHPPETTRCGCGYLFEVFFELPELLLSAKERAELTEGTYQIMRPKPLG